MLLNEIALAARAIAIILTHFSVTWFTSRLSYLCTLLKQFDKFRCYLTGIIVESNDTLC